MKWPGFKVFSIVQELIPEFFCLPEMFGLIWTSFRALLKWPGYKLFSVVQELIPEFFCLPEMFGLIWTSFRALLKWPGFKVFSIVQELIPEFFCLPEMFGGIWTSFRALLKWPGYKLFSVVQELIPEFFCLPEMFGGIWTSFRALLNDLVTSCFLLSRNWSQSSSACLRCLPTATSTAWASRRTVPWSMMCSCPLGPARRRSLCASTKWYRMSPSFCGFCLNIRLSQPLFVCHIFLHNFPGYRRFKTIMVLDPKLPWPVTSVHWWMLS